MKMIIKSAIYLSLLIFSFSQAGGDKNKPQKDGIGSDVGKNAGVTATDTIITVATPIATKLLLTSQIGVGIFGAAVVGGFIFLGWDEYQEYKKEKLLLKQKELAEKTSESKLNLTKCIDEASKKQPPVKMSCGLPEMCIPQAKSLESYVGPSGVDIYRKNQQARYEYSTEQIKADIELSKCISNNSGLKTSSISGRCKQQQKYLDDMIKKLDEVNNRQS